MVINYLGEWARRIENLNENYILHVINQVSKYYAKPNNILKIHKSRYRIIFHTINLPSPIQTVIFHTLESNPENVWSDASNKILLRTSPYFSPTSYTQRMNTIFLSDMIFEKIHEVSSKRRVYEMQFVRKIILRPGSSFTLTKIYSGTCLSSYCVKY